MPTISHPELKNLERPIKSTGESTEEMAKQERGSRNQSQLKSPGGPRRLRYAIPLLLLGLLVAFCVGLYVGYQKLDFALLQHNAIARNVFFRLRLSRVIMAAIVGASLASVGAALQSLFRNPLAEPFTLGVSGGAALGAGIAIVLGLGVRVAGVPIIFVAAFAGSLLAVFVVYRLART